MKAGEEGRRISSEMRPGSESGLAEMLAQGEVPIAARREDGSPEKEEPIGRQLAKTLLAIIHEKVSIIIIDCKTEIMYFVASVRL